MPLTQVKGSVIDRGVYVTDYGAVGDGVTDDTAGIQAAIDTFKNPSLTNIPGTSFQDRAFAGRVLDLSGKVCVISSPLNLDDAYGITVQNGTLIATGTWGADDAMIEGSLTTNIHLKDLVLECDNRTNGISLDRPIHGKISSCKVQGFGYKTFGIRSETAFGGLTLIIDSCRIAGPIGQSTDSFLSPTATGILLAGGSDSLIVNTETIRVNTGVDVTGGGWRIDNCHFTGSDGALYTGVHVRDGANYIWVTNCDFDHSYLHLEGTARWNISHNFFRNTVSEEQEYAILWEASSPSQARSKVTIRDNLFSSSGTPANFEFIRDKEESGNTFDGHSMVNVGGNSVQQQSAIPAGLVSPRATKDTAVIEVEPADWVGKTLEIDMSGYLLGAKPPAATPPFLVTGCSANGGSLLGYGYSHRNGLLHLSFDSIFEGTMALEFEWGYLTLPLDAQPYGTNLISDPNDFSTVWGLTTATVTADDAVGPGGATDADKFVEAVGTNIHRLSQTITKSSAAELTYIYSMYAKAAERTSIQIRLRGSSASDYGYATVDLSNGTAPSFGGFGTFAGHAIDVEVINSGDDWYKVVITALTDNYADIIVSLYLVDGVGATNYNGDGTSGVHLWGARLQEI